MAGPLDAGAGGYMGVGGDGPGAAPSMAQMTTLGTTPGPDAGIRACRFSIPYDGTVWPQGLLAPLLQWNPGRARVRLRVRAHQGEELRVPGLLRGEQDALREPAHPARRCGPPRRSRTAASPSSSRSSFGRARTRSGRCTESWTIAQATLQGTIYYNSYGTALVKNSDGNDHYGQLSTAPARWPSHPAPTAPCSSPASTRPAGTAPAAACATPCSADGKSLVTQASNAQRQQLRDTRST